MMRRHADGIQLSPGRDLLPVNIILPADRDQMALTLNGKNRNLRRGDFLALAINYGLNQKAAEKMIEEIVSKKDTYISLCRESYMPDDYKDALFNLIEERMQALK